MTHEEQVIQKIGSLYIVEKMARIEINTLDTTIDELLIPVRDPYARNLINEMYDYIILQKQMIEELATAIRLQDHPIRETGFVPMSKPARKI